MLQVTFSGKLIELIVTALSIFITKNGGPSADVPGSLAADSPPPLPATDPTPPPPPPPASDVETDSAGTPWDARIHASNKATVRDGTWRRKPKITDDLYNSVMAEITGQPATPPPPPANPAPATPPPPPPANTAPATPPPPPPGTGAMTFIELMQKCNAANISIDQRNEAAQSLGLLGVTSLAAEPEKIPEVAALLGIA